MNFLTFVHRLGFIGTRRGEREEVGWTLRPVVLLSGQSVSVPYCHELGESIRFNNHLSILISLHNSYLLGFEGDFSIFRKFLQEILKIACNEQCTMRTDVPPTCNSK